MELRASPWTCDHPGRAVAIPRIRDCPQGPVAIPTEPRPSPQSRDRPHGAVTSPRSRALVKALAACGGPTPPTVPPRLRPCAHAAPAPGEQMVSVATGVMTHAPRSHRLPTGARGGGHPPAAGGCRGTRARRHTRVPTVRHVHARDVHVRQVPTLVQAWAGSHTHRVHAPVPAGSRVHRHAHACTRLHARARARMHTHARAPIPPFWPLRAEPWPPQRGPEPPAGCCSAGMREHFSSLY